MQAVIINTEAGIAITSVKVYAQRVFETDAFILIDY